MSGLEIAGLVLGAFPILCESAAGLRSVFQDVGSWWQFERSFEGFILDIEKEHIVFSQVLEILVEPLDDLSREERDTLRDNPDSPLWFEPRIQKQLEHRFSTKYQHDWFMKQLKGMNDALNKLHKMLPFDQVHLLDSTSLESEMFRIKTSFSHKKDEYLTQIKTKNAELYEVLEREQVSRLSRATVPATTKGNDWVVASFLEFQEQARSVFKGFQQHWTCSCHCASGHPCRISARETNLRVLFDNGAEKTHIKVEVEKTQKLPPSPEKAPATPKVSIKREEVAVLTQQVSQKSRFSKMKDKGQRGIMRLTTSSLSSLSLSGAGTEGGDNTSLEKPPEKLKKRSRVQFDQHRPISAPAPAPVPVATVTIPTPAKIPQDEAISDICRAISKPEPFLGYLELNDAKLLLHLDPPIELPDIHVETLDEFIKTTPRRDARLRLGLSITSTILNLGPSWVPETWHKSSLVLLRTAEAQPHPYISHPSIHTTLKAALTAESSKARATLLTLGILLLELLFRDTLERQPFRATYLDPQGRPTDLTDFCTAMQWQKEVEMEFGDKIADVIRRCVHCAFGPAPDLSSSAFVKAVWVAVARPLEEFLKAYSN